MTSMRGAPDMTQPWESEAAFSTEHLEATRTQQAGDDSLMDALVARLYALEGAGKAFFPDQPTASA